MTDWVELPSIDIVEYPVRFNDVLEDRAMWTKPIGWLGNDIIQIVGPRRDEGIRYVRDWEQPPEAGARAWRKHDPRHPRCWSCGRFLMVPKRRGLLSDGPTCYQCYDGPERW